jgi:prophage antirepressor-like protein
MRPERPAASTKNGQQGRIRKGTASAKNTVPQQRKKSMSTEIIPFEFESQNIRVVNIDDEPNFVLADICRALDLTNPSKVASQLPDALTKSYPIVDSLGRTQSATIVSEPGLYRVIMRSNSPKAEPIIEWVTAVVLPQIRKTGSYSVAKPLSLAEQMAQGLIAAQTLLIEAQNKVLELTPMAEAFQTFVSEVGDHSVREIIKIMARDHGIEMPERKFYEWLAAKGLAYKQGFWQPKAEMAARKFMALKPQKPYFDAKQNEFMPSNPQLRITRAGLMYVVNRLRKEIGAVEDGLESAA